MLPRTHTFLGIIFSLVIAYSFNLSLIAGIIIFLSSVLIDVDHYLYYVYKKKDWSLKRAYNFFIVGKNKIASLSRKQRNEFYHGFSFLHGIETLVILFILGKFLSEYFYYILIGFSFHLFLDIIHQKTIHDRFDKYSIIYDYFKYKKLGVLEEMKGYLA
ncbi:MAG: metal-dependent hydrolase [Nanoarchaeota archaeon]|nr:metal-dependent hydrolase [Nanoarchaeota archaeon]